MNLKNFYYGLAVLNVLTTVYDTAHGQYTLALLCGVLALMMVVNARLASH